MSWNQDSTATETVDRVQQLRREGRAEEACRIVEEALASGEHPELCVAFALAQLDLGRPAAAREALEYALTIGLPEVEAAVDDEDAADVPEAVVPEALPSIDESEIEQAFDAAESRPDEMWNANHLAEAALRQVEAEGRDPVRFEDGSPFATETVAGLLEDQGHAGHAHVVREALSSDGEEEKEGAKSPQLVIDTLERWLDNLRSTT